MADDEVPQPIARVIGHVCGVIAVAMAVLGVLGLWALAHRPTLPGSIMELICIGIAALLFRWAGALTGYWDTRGRLAVPKMIYSGLGAIFAALAVLSVGLAVAKWPLSLDDGLAIVFGALSGIALTYLCYLAYTRFK